jgi:hypothetical protein
MKGGRGGEGIVEKDTKRFVDELLGLAKGLPGAAGQRDSQTKNNDFSWVFKGIRPIW